MAEGRMAQVIAGIPEDADVQAAWFIAVAQTDEENILFSIANFGAGDQLVDLLCRALRQLSIYAEVTPEDAREIVMAALTKEFFDEERLRMDSGVQTAESID